MPFPPFAPSIYFEEDELRALMVEFGERLRADACLRPMLDRVIGNRWLEAEQGAEAFLNAALFLETVPEVDQDWLARAVQFLSQGDIERLCDIMLDCSLSAFPLHGAAVVIEATEALAALVNAIVTVRGKERDRRLATVTSRLNAGALMHRL